jgi:hypothetical protein
MYPWTDVHTTRDLLTVSAWNLLGLTTDITRAKTHFLLLTLRRTSSSNPRTFYSLIDVAAIPLSALERAYASRVTLAETRVSPMASLAEDEQRRKRDGALGSVMVVSVELPEGDNRSPHEALDTVCTHIPFRSSFLSTTSIPFVAGVRPYYATSWTF